MLVLGSMTKLLISFLLVLMLVTSFVEIIAQVRPAATVVGHPRPKGAIFKQVPVYRSKEDSIKITKAEKFLLDAYNAKPTNQKLTDSLMAIYISLDQNGIIRYRKKYASQLGTFSRNGFTPYTTFDSLISG